MARFSRYRAVAPALVEQRAAQRHLVHVRHATVSRRGNVPAEALLHDLSIYGCRLAARLTHAAGERLWIGLSEAEAIGAIVVWNDGAQLGCRFDAPIARSLVRALTLAIR